MLDGQTEFHCDVHQPCKRNSIVKHQQLIVIRCTLGAGVSRYAKNKQKSKNHITTRYSIIHVLSRQRTLFAEPPYWLRDGGALRLPPPPLLTDPFIELGTPATISGILARRARLSANRSSNFHSHLALSTRSPAFLNLARQPSTINQARRKSEPGCTSVGMIVVSELTLPPASSSATATCTLRSDRVSFALSLWRSTSWTTLLTVVVVVGPNTLNPRKSDTL